MIDTMWKILNESVEGTSHRRSDTPCQDASYCTGFAFGDDEGVILACADGAGSAVASQVGSKLACEEIVRRIHQYLEQGGTIAGINRDAMLVWFTDVHAAIESEALRISMTIRDLACTLLVAVVGRTHAVFSQIGDGGIVVLQDQRYRPIFWPESGEYLNTTYFISEAGFAEHVQFEMMEKPVEELAMFSDGLQMVALNFADHSAHQPFFLPLFQSIRKAEEYRDLSVPMRQFLDSDGINARTDDDKTLILATRISPDVAESA